ncbi:MAG: hypothetical protein KDB01_12960 [Planctomycetaceae bacterium]|nr:hypothetical protein [Planctomycetaceae bacterium]
MNRFPYAIGLVLVCMGSGANAQVSAPQLEKLHYELEELRAQIEFLELMNARQELQSEAEQAKMEQYLNQSKAQIVHMQKDFHERIETMESHVRGAVSELKRLDAVNRHLRLRLQDERDVEIDQEVDGRIVSLAHNLKTVEIDLGHADAAFVGLQLDVLFAYELIGQHPSDAETALSLLLQDRCRIEVIRIDSANRSLAKILPGSNPRSLQVGAAVASPLWERRQRHRVVILEDIDNEDLIRQALWEAGLETHKLTNESRISELIDGQTQYVVVAGFDRFSVRDDSDLSKNYWSSLTLAREFAIPVLTAKRLLMRHPIPEPGTDAATQMLDRFQQRREEMPAKLAAEGEPEDHGEASTVKPATPELEPEVNTSDDPFGSD